MIKSFIYTLSLVIIVLAFMILTIVSHEGLVLGGIGWKILFPYMTVVGSILLMYHAHHFWCAILRIKLPDNHDDCPPVVHSIGSADAARIIREYQQCTPPADQQGDFVLRNARWLKKYHKTFDNPKCICSKDQTDEKWAVSHGCPIHIGWWYDQHLVETE